MKHAIAFAAMLLSLGCIHTAQAGEEEAVTRYGKVSVRQKSDDMKVLVAGRRELPLSDYRVAIEQQFQVGERDVLFVAAASGGNACPSLYAFVVLERNKAAVSDTFGNCSDLPKVVRRGDRIVVRFPGSRQVPGVVVEFDGVRAMEGAKPLKMQSVAF
jgi:hypothetical protein